MKRLPPAQKQSIKELMEYALTMPVGDLQKYGTLFLSGPVPATMTRGELIALQLVERASYGDLDALKELRAWIAEDPKRAATPEGGTTYYQFLVQLSNGQVPSDGVTTPTTARSLQAMARAVGASTRADLPAIPPMTEEDEAEYEARPIPKRRTP